MVEFPVIELRDVDNQVEAVVAMRLNSLLKEDLVSDLKPQGEEGDYSSESLKKKLQDMRELFLTALSAWDFATTLELRFNVVPDLQYKVQGKVAVCLLLICQAATEEDAKEIIISRYLSLLPILASYIPEAQWVPVRSKGELGNLLNPFAPKHAIGIHRKKEKVTISTALSRASIGFGSSSTQVENSDAVIEQLFPWVPSGDDWAKLINVMVGQLDPVQLIVRLKPVKEPAKYVEGLTTAIKACEVYLSGHQDHLTHSRLVTLLRDGYLLQLTNLKEQSFRLGVFLVSPCNVDSSLSQVVGRSVSSTRNGNGDSMLFKGGFDVSDVPAGEVWRSGYFFEEEEFSLVEAASAFRLPSPPSQDVPGLPIRRFRSAFAKIPIALQGDSEAIKLFVNSHQGQNQPVYIDSDSRMRHCFILGQTGTGKSACMESMILQDIDFNKGVAVVDPHGDMADSLMQRIPEHRVKDVVLFDLVDREHPIGFNLFAWKNIDERDLIIDELYRTLDHIYDMKQTGGPIFESHFRNMMKLLMGDIHRPKHTPTILEFIKCYLDKKYRHWLMESIADQQVKDFIMEAEDVNGDASLRNISPYVTSKFSRFVNDTTLRRIIGQSRSSIDFESIMEDGKILFLKLGKGRFGSEVSALLANIIVAKFKFAAMKRGEKPAESRRDFYLYVDEAHNLPQSNFTELLSEARKYRLGLILSTQYCSQLGDVAGRKSNDLLSSILGNVGTTMIFRTGMTDAEHLSKGLYPYFSQQDIINLPNFHGYARMNLANNSVRPFSFHTELCDVPKDEELGKLILANSRMKYGKKARDVDAEIRQRDEFWKNSPSV